jgi:hypothetical protein
MSDIKLFRLSAGHATELQGSASELVKPLHASHEQSPGRSSLNRKSKEKPHA